VDWFTFFSILNGLSRYKQPINFEIIDVYLNKNLPLNLNWQAFPSRNWVKLSLICLDNYKLLPTKTLNLVLTCLLENLEKDFDDKLAKYSTNSPKDQELELLR
jgi:hypothetical protein